MRIGMGIGIGSVARRRQKEPVAPSLAPLSPFDATQPVSAAYSWRKINPAYAGACLQLRTVEGGSNKTWEIGWIADPNGGAFPIVDVATMNARIAASDGGAHYITRWYDQSGNGRHLGNGSNTTVLKAATAANAAGTALPTLDFDGSAGTSTLSTTTAGVPAWLNSGGTYNLSVFVNAEIMGVVATSTGAQPRTYPQNASGFNAVMLSASSALPIMVATKAASLQTTAYDGGENLRLDAPIARTYPLGLNIATPPALQLTGPRVANRWMNQKGALLSGGGGGFVSITDRAHGVAASAATTLFVGALGGASRPANARLREVILFNNAGALSDEECRRIDLWQGAYWPGVPARAPMRLAVTMLGESTAQGLASESSDDAGMGYSSWARVLIPQLLAQANRSYADTDIVFRNVSPSGYGTSGSYCLPKPQTPAPPNGTWQGQSSGLAYQKFWWDHRYGIPGPCYWDWRRVNLDSAYGGAEAPTGARWMAFVTQGINDTEIAETQAQGITFANWKAGWKSVIALARADVGAGDFPFFFSMAKRPGVQPTKEMRMRDIWEEIAAELPNCYLLPEGGLISLRGDGTHYQTGPGLTAPNNTAPAYGPEGSDRLAHWIARGMAAKALGAPVAWRGPELAPTFARVGPAVLDFTVTYPEGCAGTDFGPAVGIFGFTIYDAGVAKAISSAVRVDPTTIRVTAAAALTGTVTADYVPNSASDGAEAEGGIRVRDNTIVGTTGLPLRQRRAMAQTA